MEFGMHINLNKLWHNKKCSKWQQIKLFYAFISLKKISLWELLAGNPGYKPTPFVACKAHALFYIYIYNY